MRKAINDNPVVQIAVIGVLVVVVGLFMMMNLKKKSGSSASSSSSSPVTAESSASGGSSPVTGAAGAPSSSGSSIGTVPPATSGTVTPEALIPGPGLPKDVVDAWKSGDTVVLLIIRGGGVDDRMVRGSVESLSGDSSVSVFVARASHIARYSRITQGVGVDRVPALVVVRPRKESGSVPEAQVSYGFRNSQGVVQAVHDALYNGRDDLPYSPR